MTLRCLLVDDSEEFLASATRLLESQGIEIVARATSGEEALRRVAELTPDVVLVDVELGDEDGIVLARDLEVHAPSTRVVLISTYRREDLVDLISESRVLGFIPKSALGAKAIEGLLGAA
jgi:two-component system, NarL family, nitrate/nitrite response regulator NarL